MRLPCPPRLVSFLVKNKSQSRLSKRVPFLEATRVTVHEQSRFFTPAAHRSASGVSGRPSTDIQETIDHQLAESEGRDDTRDSKSATDSTSKSVYVLNFPWTVDSARLANEFADCGAIVSARVLVDDITLQSRGSGFVNFADVQGASRAVALSGYRRIDGRLLSIMPSKTSPLERQKETRPFNELISNEPTTVLFVRNVGFDVSEDNLRMHFKRFGRVYSVHVLRSNGASGKSKGCAYVEFVGVEDAKRAYEDANASFLYGRELKMNFAKPKVRSRGGNTQRD